MADPTATTVHTDGACLYPTPADRIGPGGWAWVDMATGDSDAGGQNATTNQRMELLAVVRALEAIDGPIEIVTDSAYIVNCLRDRWWEKWVANGWRTAKRKPVQHRDL